MKEKINNILKNINVVEWVLLAIVVSICFVCFQFPDILHTGGSSITYLNGNIRNFYEVNKKALGSDNYMPTTYILFAVWNILIRVLGLIKTPTMAVGAFVRMWYKLGTSILYLATTILIYKICKLRKLDTKTAAIGAFIFASSPVGIFSQFIFGQYDIITTFFVVLGIYYYLQKKEKGFIAAFAVAVTCKYFALLVFIPLLLLREKNVWKIIKKVFAFGSLFIVETLFYIGSEAFKEGVFGFGATGYVFKLGLNNGYRTVSLFMMAWIILCAFSYFKEVDEKEEFEWIIYILNILSFIMFGMSYWHPQWLLMAVPFWSLGLIFHKKSNIFMLLDALFGVVYIAFTVTAWYGSVDQHMFYGGIFRKYVEGCLQGKTSMAELLGITDLDMLFSILASLMIVYAIFTHPKYLAKDEKEVMIENNKGLVQLRYLPGIGFFLIVAFTCLYMNMTSVVTFESGDSVNIIQTMDDSIVIEQKFLAESDTIDEFSIKTATYDRKNNFEIKAYLMDLDGNILTETQFNASSLKDNAYKRFAFDKKVKVEIGQSYILKFVSEGATDTNTISFYRGVDKAEDNLNMEYAIIGNNEQPYDISVRIFGDKE